MSYSQTKELELLKNKLDQLKKIGCTGFAVRKNVVKSFES